MTARIAVRFLLARTASGQSVYQDPDRQFTARVPAGWRASKAPDRAATVRMKSGTAYVNMSVEPALSGVQISHERSWSVISPFGGSAPGAEVSSVPMAEAQAASPALTEIVQTIRFDDRP